MSDEPICNDRGEYKLFVSGLPWACDDDMLWTKFAEHGEVSFSRVCMDQDSGRSRGFGFVSYRDAESAKKAQNGMDGADMEGRAIKCAYATDRPKEQGGANGAKPICYAHEKGECSRGDACRFSHDGGKTVGSGAAQAWAKPPCFAFQKGECWRGDECRFSHEVEGEKTEEAEVCVKKAEEPAKDDKKRKFEDKSDSSDDDDSSDSDDSNAKPEKKAAPAKKDSDSDSSSDDSSDDEEAKAAAAAKKLAEEKAAAEAKAAAEKAAAKAAKKEAKSAKKAKKAKKEKKEKKEKKAKKSKKE